MAENTAVAPTAQNSVIHRIAARYGVMPGTLRNTLMATIMPGKITEEQFLAVMMVADAYKLNPLTKEIYAFPGKGGGVVPIVGIDGWTRIMNEHPQMDGIQYEYITDGDHLRAIKAIIFRKDRGQPVEVTEWMAECKGNTEPWKRWPARMLRHKATIQCARLAFGFAGIYDPDEADRIVSVSDIASVQHDEPVKSGVAALAEAAGIEEEPTPEEPPAKPKKKARKAKEPDPPQLPPEMEEPEEPLPPVDMEPTQEAMDFFGETP